MKFRLAIFMLAVVLALALVHLYVYTQNITLKFQITDLKVKLSELRSRNRSLAAEAARRENLKEIEKMAREKLGMFYPEKIIYLPRRQAGLPRPSSTESDTAP